MIDLYQFPRAFGVANLSPFCMKVEAFLRIADIPYQVIETNDLRLAPKGKLPFIRDNGIAVSDSEFIMDYLQSKHGFEVDGHLDTRQKVLHHALSRMLDEHLYWVLMYSRYIEPKNWQTLKQHLYGHIPPPVSTVLAKKTQDSMQRQLYAQGLGRHNAEEIYRKAGKDIEALAYALGSQSWFGGDYISRLDLAAIAYLSNALLRKLSSPLTEKIQRYENLLEYLQRAESAVFPDFMELNSEITP